MTEAGRIVVVGEALRAGSSMDDAVDEVVSSLAEQRADGEYAVAILDREHGGEVLAIGFRTAVGAGDASLAAKLGAAMARHFARVSAPFETSTDLLRADD